MIFRIILYLAAIGFCLFFALYMSAGVGWVFIYMLVFSPLFSIGVTVFFKLTHKVTVYADIDRSMLYKGETVTLRITAQNKSIYPVPAVKVKLFLPKNLDCPENSASCVLSIPPRSKAELKLSYKAKVWGSCQIGAESAVMYDYMGFVKFSVPCVNAAHEVKIFPNIPDIPGDSPLLRAAAERAKFYDESEDTKENDGSIQFGGMPGYTHREYIEGDPVRRINWKLSSKRDKYMVRLDDEVETVQQKIVLDPCGGFDVYENERAVEGMLAAALGLLKCGFESTVYCYFKGMLETFGITEPADVTALQTRMADYRFENGGVFGGERIPLSVISESGGSGILLYTPLFDKPLNGEISAAESAGILTAVISTDSVSSGSAYEVWRLAEDFSAEMM